ncbi:hypothetical protein [Homoserinibacter gongjuensis]|uniref:hypothetical protein n=1 Tax=Homoserinibacter gongjuensis TaxID=1162968 RepID=UPI0024E18D6D|nr:hypothetical protein [Homoserinibacter gongjuensis]
MSALSTAGLLRAHLRSGLGAAALTATLVAVTVFVAAAVPSALAALTTAQLQHAASELSTARRDLTASGPSGPASPSWSPRPTRSPTSPTRSRSSRANTASRSRACSVRASGWG